MGVAAPVARILSRLASGDRVAALTAALRVTSGSDAPRLAADLLATPTPRLPAAAIAAAAATWPVLDPVSRTRLLAAGQGRWGEVVPLLAEDPREAARLALVHIAAEQADPALVAALPRLLADPDPAVAEAAGERLLALCTSAPDRPDVQAAAAHAFENFGEHRRPAAAMAIALLAGPLGAVHAASVLGRIAADHELPGHSGLRRLIRRGSVGPEQVWLWLRHPAWAGACIERLTADDPERAAALRAAMIDRVHLAEHPLRRRHLARARAEASRGRNAEPQPMALDEPGWRIAAAARLLVATGARAGEFDRWAAPLLPHPDPVARAGIGRIAAAMVGRPAVLLDLCFDADERTAYSSLLALGPWRRVGYLPDPEVDRAVRAATRSPHPRVRALAADLRITPEGWIAAGDGAARGRLAARAALATDREHAEAQIRAKMLGSAAEACGALALTVHLGLVGTMEPEILELARSSQDAHIRATAATALGHCLSPASLESLRRLFDDDPDARVRSNALEAMTRRTRRDPHAALRLRSLAGAADRDDAHRLRASALRARLLTAPDPDTVAALGAMLADPRPAHRVAALWLASRAAPGSAAGGWGQVAARVAEMACADPDPRVRARAGRCSHTLMARLRSAWTVRVRDLAPAEAVA